ncbi:MAG: transporter [Vicinamibacteraceae bacterium]
MTAPQTLRPIVLAIARLSLAAVWPVVMATPAAGQPAQTPREAVRDLLPGSSAAEVSAVAQAVLMQVSSVPIGSSSGAFTFVHDDATGEQSLKAFSFGPSFAERPTTLGKAGAFTLGTTYQHTTFRTFEGVSLRGGLRAEVRVDGRPALQLFSASVDVSTSSTSFVGTLGVTKDIDVAVSVPWVQLSVAGMRTSGAASAAGAGVVIREIETSGFGDIQVRAKWAPYQSDRGGAALAFEARLPTGSQAALIGSPGIRPRVLFLGSTTAGMVSPHINLSYQFGGDGAVVQEVPGGLDELIEARLGREFGYTLGAEVAAHPKLTFSVDLLGRSLRNAARFRFEDRGLGAGQGTPEMRAAFAQLSQLGHASVYSLNPRVENLNRWLLAVGAKTSVLGRGLVRIDVLGSLNDAGLKPGITTVLGLEYTF